MTRTRTRKPYGGNRGRACPDCRAVGRPHFRHDSTCPLALAADRVQAADRAWFDAHPLAPHYRRPAQRAEAVDLQLVGVLPPGRIVSVGGTVRVVRIAVGLRTRDFGDMFVVIGPDEVTT
jgi:hypothetical protein